MAQVYGAIGAEFAVGDGIMYAVVEDHAVLQYLGYGCTLVACGGHKHFLRCGEFYVDRTAEEVATRAEDEFGRDEGVFGSAVGRRLGHESAV